MRAIICDLDGTLTDTSHRLHHVQGPKKDWDAFFDGIPDDPIVGPVADIVDMYAADGAAILLCSGRPEKCREKTQEWLNKNDVEYTQLYMRPDDDRRPDHIVKAQILDGILADGYEPIFVLDDRSSVVKMWRERGLTCLQCALSEPEIPNTAILSLMVGPSGAGKSSWLRSGDQLRYDILSSHIVSSDDIRQNLCGDWRDQSKNNEVFAALHAIVSTRLRNGLPTVVDATNLRRRDRLEVASLAQGRCPVRYFVIDRPMEEKRRDGGWRNEIPDFDLIGKHDQTFRSQIKDILAGDNLPNVTVIDLRHA